MQLLGGRLGRSLAGLGRHEEATRLALQPRADAELGIAICGGSVDVVDAELKQHLECSIGNILGHSGECGRTKDDATALVARSSETVFGDHHRPISSPSIFLDFWVICSLAAVSSLVSDSSASI